MLAKFVAIKIEKNNIITDNIPHAISAGIIYFVSQYCALNISKTEIKSVSGVSEVTINKCFKTLDIIHDKLLPKAILAKYA